MNYIIKDAFVVNPRGAGGRLDIHVVNGEIARLGESLDAADAQVVHAQGLTIFPGLIDMHCHLRDPGFEYKEDIRTGTYAAAAGGFTGVACMPNTHPVCDSEAVVQYILEKAAREGSARVYPIAAITKGLKGKELSEMGLLGQAGAVAFSDDGQPVEDSRMMRLALQYAMNFDALLISHCEDKSLVAGGVMNEGVQSTKLGLPGATRAAEELMLTREIILAETLGAKVHIAHVSTRAGVESIRQAKARGVRVTAETCPHYFAATDALVEGYDTNTRVNPPLRTEDDRQAVLQGLRDGTIDAIATDHAPHHADEKAVEYNLAASGISGFETAFALAYTHCVQTGVLSLDDLALRISAAPADILGVPGGVLCEGAPADMTVVDLEAGYPIDVNSFQSKGKNNPFGGWQVSGRVEATAVGGNFVYNRGNIRI